MLHPSSCQSLLLPAPCRSLLYLADPHSTRPSQSLPLHLYAPCSLHFLTSVGRWTFVPLPPAPCSRVGYACQHVLCPVSCHSYLPATTPEGITGGIFLRETFRMSSTASFFSAAQSISFSFTTSSDTGFVVGLTTADCYFPSCSIKLVTVPASSATVCSSLSAASSLHQARKRSWVNCSMHK